MNKKHTFAVALITFFTFALIYFSSLFSIFIISKNNRENFIITQTINISKQYESGTNIEELVESYSNIDACRLSFIQNGNTIADSMENYYDPEKVKPNSFLTFYTKEAGEDFSYYTSIINVNESTAYYVRFGMEIDTTTIFAKNFLIYGSLGLIVLFVLYIIFVNIDYNKSLKPLKIQIRKLQKITFDDKPIEYDEDLNYLAVIIRDSRKQLSKQLALTKTGEQKIRFILDSFSEGLIVIDSNYKIQMFNHKAEEIFNVNQVDAINKSFEILKKAAELEGNMSMCVQTLRSITYNEAIDGRIYECIINPINYEWNMVNEKPGASLLMIDITEEYNSSEMKKQFFMNASHELKTPLTSILGYQEMMKTGVFSTEEEINRAIDKTIKEATRMKKIIFDMLELSSLENEKLRAIEPLDVRQEIKNVLTSLDYEINLKHIKTEINEKTFIVQMNMDDFSKLIKNIIENAIIYNKENGKILINLDNLNKTVSIKDTGIGINESDISRVFERFYRVDKARSRKDGGTGLGLAIVKHVCEYYQIKIEVRSKINEGTEFLLKF